MADDIKVIIGVDSAPVQRAVQLMNNLESEVRGVEKAEKRGLITRQRAAAETKRLTDQMARLKQVSAGSAKGFYNFEKALVGSGKMARRNEVAFQQAGYQVQDFIVQVQGGTNPLIAFSQQGSQLAGFFAGPWGAMIGLGIAALSSLAMAFVATGGKAKSFKDQIGETESSLDSYFSLLKSQSWVYDDVFERNIESLKLTSETAKSLLAIAKIEAFKSIDGLAKSLANANTEAGFFRKLMLGTDISLVGDLLNIETLLKGNITQWKSARGQVEEFIEAVRGIAEADSMDAMYEQAMAVKRAFEENVDINADMTDQQMKFYKQLLTTIEQLEIMGASNKALEAGFKDTTRSTKAAADAAKLFYENLEAASDKAKELKEAVNKIRDTVDNQVKTLQQKLALNEAELKYGKLSQEYQKLLAEQQRAQFEALQKSNGILGDNLTAVMALYDANVLIEGSLRRQNEISYGMMEGSAGAKALRKYGGRGTTSDKDPIFGDGTSIYSEGTPSGGGGTTPKDPLAELLKRITLDEKLLGVSKEREAVLRAIANSDKEYSDAAINGAISRLEAYNKEKELLEESAAQQQNIADTLKNSMEGAFMSIVDGTKSAEDAFKDMARMIISELYKVLVVQQMVGSFSSGGGGILGALAPIFGRASGGTVMSNQPYLVGEKGPEVIVPQNRGHVMNADLTAKAMGGSGESVVVNQSFNFQANGDDSVKKLIAQAAPQIANMTQKQIMDSRRRGGAMKSTFG